MTEDRFISYLEALGAFLDLDTRLQHHRIVTDGGTVHCVIRKSETVNAFCGLWPNEERDYLSYVRVAEMPAETFETYGGLETLSKIAASVHARRPPQERI